MKNNKHILIIILGCLFFGAVIGWSLRGSDELHPEGEHTHIAADGTEYTCSMHPQIRQKEPGQCPLCGMALTPVTSGNTSNDPFVLEMTPEAVAMSNVQTLKISSSSMDGEIRLTGKIQPNEQRVKSLTANYSGRIENLFINFTGQEVKKGQKLATVYSPELVTAQKELLETVKIKTSQPALYAASKEKLRLWNITEDQINAIENSGAVKTQFDIYAQSSGVVTARNVSMGDFVNRGTSLFEVVDLSQVWVIFDAYESDLGGIKRGDEVTFTVSAYPGKNFKAQVAFIDPSINSATRTLAIRAEAPNPGFELKPEMFVSGVIKGKGNTGIQGLIVPKTAILWTGKRSILYVKKGTKDAPAFEMREVTLGNSSGAHYLVLEGVEEGEEVVVNGVFAIDAAAQLSGKYSMMGKPESKNLEVAPEFINGLMNVVQQYIKIKDALVKSDLPNAKTEAGKFSGPVQQIDVNSLDSKAKEVWLGLQQGMKKDADELAKAKDLKLQRKAFQKLSEKIIEAVEIFGVENQMVYLQFCPMADEDRGAFWLSLQKDIKNPYFGDAMLTCGEVKETYQKGKINYSKQTNQQNNSHQH
jgi:membrane fusion protein, copper/silver efflux system